jgi:hypothetical protein
MMPPINCLPSTHRIIPGSEPSYNDLLEDPSSHAERVEPPQLIPPERISSGYALLNAINGICGLRESMMNTSTLRLETMKTEIEEASAKLMQKLKEAANEAKNNDFWSMLKKVATCLFSALSSILGLAVIGSGGSALVGGAMVASGLLSLANLVLSECEGWDWITDQLAQGSEETKQKLLLFLPAAVGLVAGAFGLVGSVYGITSGALDFTQKIGGIAQTAFALFGGATNLGKGTSDAKLIWVQADLASKEEELKMKQEACGRFTDDVNTTLEGFNRTFQQAKSAIRSLTKTQSQLTR